MKIPKTLLHVLFAFVSIISLGQNNSNPPRNWSKSVGTPNLRTFISIPASKSEYCNIFGKSKYNPIQMENTLTFRDKLEKTQGDYLSFMSSKEEVIEEIVKGNSKIIVIIGHNHKGVLKLPVGNPISIEEIDMLAETYNRIPVYLSCESKTYTKFSGVRNVITYSQANRLNSALKRKLSLATQSSDTKEIINRINSLLEKEDLKISLMKDVKVAGTVVSVGTVVLFILNELKEKE